MGFSVVSCSSDNKDDDGGNDTEEVVSLVGTWKYNFSTGYQLITFKSNGKGTVKEIDYEAEDYEESFTYSYNANSQILRMYWDGEDPSEWQVVSNTSNKLVLIDENGMKMTCTKQ